MAIRLDGTVMSSMHESYKNYRTISDSFVISGTVAPGGREYGVEIPFDRENTRCDIYIQRSGNDYRRPANTRAALVEYTGATSATVVVRYDRNSVFVGAYVNNFGGSNITAQTGTYNVRVVQYDAPISL